MKRTQLAIDVEEVAIAVQALSGGATMKRWVFILAAFTAVAIVGSALGVSPTFVAKTAVAGKGKPGPRGPRGPRSCRDHKGLPEPTGAAGLAEGHKGLRGHKGRKGLVARLESRT